MIEQAQAEMRAVELREVLWHRPGQPRVFDIVVLPLRDDAGRLLGVGVNFHEVTRFHRLRDAFKGRGSEASEAAPGHQA